MSKIRYILAFVLPLLAAPVWAQSLHDGDVLQSDTICFDDGSIYMGQVCDSLFNGFGKMIYADSTVYEGYWKDGLWDGSGILEYPDGDRYEGEFRNHQFEGEGKYSYAGGAYYSGSWKEGRFDGVGTLRYEDGSYYAGEWKEERKWGYGVLFSAQDNVLVSGTFVDDELSQSDEISIRELTEPEEQAGTSALSFTVGMQQSFGIQYLAMSGHTFSGLSLSWEPCYRARGEESSILGEDGYRYYLIMWDDKPNEVLYEGEYMPISLYLDLGYRFERMALGISLGGGLKESYQNCRALDNSVFETGTQYYKTRIKGFKFGYRVFGQYSAKKFRARHDDNGYGGSFCPELIFTLGYGNIDKLFFGLGLLF